MVQNQFIEMLLETGLLGLLGFFALLGFWLWATKRHKWLWAILAAFVVQLNFFSGYPNSLHIYLFLAVSAALCLAERKSKSSAAKAEKPPSDFGRLSRL
ncbi:MAG: hypothetical protein LBM73_01760 [Candidatus Nomurabacteria bacterium]|jgi:4-amino-4-deoxy-L-arabinose transferase-like glycosyltransferase|nr:hypothetical protein [Candidatus Nomurabacteria bacterium]